MIYENVISTRLKTKEKIIFASSVLVCSFAKELCTAGSVLQSLIYTYYFLMKETKCRAVFLLQIPFSV